MFLCGAVFVVVYISPLVKKKKKKQNTVPFGENLCETVPLYFR